MQELPWTLGEGERTAPCQHATAVLAVAHSDTADSTVVDGPALLSKTALAASLSKVDSTLSGGVLHERFELMCVIVVYVSNSRRTCFMQTSEQIIDTYTEFTTNCDSLLCEPHCPIGSQINF